MSYWNVALLTLFLSDNETLESFIENELGISSVSRIEMKFDSIAQITRFVIGLMVQLYMHTNITGR